MHFRASSMTSSPRNVTTVTEESDGFFFVSVHRLLDESTLSAETNLSCEVGIPGTPWSAQEDTTYFKGSSMTN